MPADLVEALAAPNLRSQHPAIADTPQRDSCKKSSCIDWVETAKCGGYSGSRWHQLRGRLTPRIPRSDEASSRWATLVSGRARVRVNPVSHLADR